MNLERGDVLLSKEKSAWGSRGLMVMASDCGLGGWAQSTVKANL